MKKRLLLAIGYTLCVTLGFCQTNWKFRSDNYLGIAAGEMGSYGLLQTVNGLYKGPWFLGLGTGLDYYRFRSVPLYLSVTRDLPVASKKGGLFLNLNGGINLPWYQRDPLPWDKVSSTFNPGIWWNAGLGYRWRLSARTDKALLFSASYGVKKLTEHQEGTSGCLGCFGPALDPTPGPNINRPETFDYVYLNRELLFSIGFQF